MSLCIRLTIVSKRPGRRSFFRNSVLGGLALQRYDRGMFERCTNCGGAVMLTGRRDELGAFCSWQCQNYFRHREFCPQCLAETSGESAGGTSTINAVGTKLFGFGDPCPQCGSLVQTKCFCFFFPLIPLGRYRVLYATPTQYFSRKLVQRMPRGAATSPPFTTAAPLQTMPAPSTDAAFRCPYCGSPAPAVVKKQISPVGWILFAVLLLFCFPLCWIGLLIQDQRLECPACRGRLGG
jgi:lipopolysaccharide-induced tumor necrosis factor-alpha factor